MCIIRLDEEYMSKGVRYDYFQNMQLACACTPGSSDLPSRVPCLIVLCT